MPAVRMSGAPSQELTLQLSMCCVILDTISLICSAAAWSWGLVLQIVKPNTRIGDSEGMVATSIQDFEECFGGHIC